MTQPDNINNLRDYFALIRKRPGMYLGKNTISKLSDHLQGYKMAYWFNDTVNEVDKKFFDNFNEFVYEYYDDVDRMGSWRDIILEQCFGNEEGALMAFFELYDLFDAGAISVNSKEIVWALFDKLVLHPKESKEKLGNEFSEILSQTVALLKDNVVTNIKSDYDYILAQLEEQASQMPELKTLLTELAGQQP